VRIRIDLNADLGEGYGPWTMGDDAAMFGLVTSANIACGGHAGDPETMFRTLQLARDRGVVVGAHPSYPDREFFGRRRLPYTPAQVERFVAAQIGALAAVAALAGVRVAYVKPHGALANVASEDLAIAGAIARSVRAVDSGLAILAISGTALERVARDEGATVFSEIFADRGYTAEGNLVPRGEPGALIEDPPTATERCSVSSIRAGCRQKRRRGPARGGFDLHPRRQPARGRDGPSHPGRPGSARDRARAIYGMLIRPVGEAALLVELGTAIDPALHARIVALDTALTTSAPAWLLETVPAYASLLVSFDPLHATPETVERHIRGLNASASN
jgi:UPF0271 protein